MFCNNKALIKLHLILVCGYPLPLKEIFCYYSEKSLYEMSEYTHIIIQKVNKYLFEDENFQ